MQRMAIAATVGIDKDDRVFTRALEAGISEGRLEKPGKRGIYGLAGTLEGPAQER
jgi:hypothetical protein